MGELCRGCGKKLSENIWLKFSDMPQRAQFFPTENELQQEKGVDFVLKQCPWCGLIQAIGEPVFYYKDVIRAVGVSDEMFQFRKLQFENWVQQYGLCGKKIIEIGCGNGAFMKAMQHAGVDVYGLEHNRNSVEIANKSGYHVIEGFIENENYTVHGAPYDGFYCIEYLEHVPNPDEFLRGIANNLSEGAIGLVEVPNSELVIKNFWYWEFIQDHLCYFTIQTLTNILERNGFEVLHYEYIWHNIILSFVVKKRTQYPTQIFADKLASRRAEMKEFLDFRLSRNKTIAVWGAGHINLTEISLLNMGDKISYVLDSADFKQNKYTPVTHIPIVSPDRLKMGDINTVITMGTFAYEIKDIMNKDYPNIESVIYGENGFVY